MSERGRRVDHVMRSGADVAGVEGAGDGGVGGAFEDGAAVGENGHFIGRDAEAQEEVVVAHVRNGAREALLQGVEIEGAIVLVNLHGIATTHGDVRLGVALEIREVAFRRRRDTRDCAERSRIENGRSRRRRK